MADREGGEAVIIVKRPKKAAHGHHGGSWKIAYADFVTAMMAFFMVMWILGLDQQTRQGIESYFQNPVGLKEGYSAGASPVATGTSPATVETLPLEVLIRQQMERMQAVGERIREQLRSVPELQRLGAQVEITVTREGLRIELVETAGGETFFAFGSAQMKPTMDQALGVIAPELLVLPNPVVLEGHTDAAPFTSRRGYSNWELSSERAHAARRVLEASGLGYERIQEVRGYADKHLRVPGDPLAPQNRRITILLPISVAVPQVEHRGALPEQPGSAPAPG